MRNGQWVSTETMRKLRAKERAAADKVEEVAPEAPVKGEAGEVKMADPSKPKSKPVAKVAKVPAKVVKEKVSKPVVKKQVKK